MAIRITTKPDVHVTQDELNRYRYDFDKEGQYYCGPRRDFEEYVRQRKIAGNASKRPELFVDVIKHDGKRPEMRVHPGRHWI